MRVKQDLPFPPDSFNELTSEIKCGIMKISGAANAQIQKKGLFSNEQN